MELEDDGEDRAVPPLLPPDDRLWRHPSEVAGEVLPAPRDRTNRPPRMVTVIGLTTCISVLMSVGLIAIVGPVRTEVAVERVATGGAVIMHPGAMADVAALTEQVRPAITQVIATSASGERYGSGVIYRSDGLMLTAHRVVAGADDVRVRLDDGREIRGHVVGTDPDTEVALMRLEGNGFKPAVIGSTVGLKVGHPAITVGSATDASTGLVVRFGMVSAVGQHVGAGDGRTLFDMIQTDQPVAPGCTGGAVLDARGAVIGIAATNATSEAGVIGYVTPIDTAREVAAQLMNEGRVSRGWLGIEGDGLPGEKAQALTLRGGVMVKKVKPGSPAEGAGLAVRDVIVEAEGQQLTSMSQLVMVLRSRRPGDTISLSVLRNDSLLTIKVKLGRQPG